MHKTSVSLLQRLRGGDSETSNASRVARGTGATGATGAVLAILSSQLDDMSPLEAVPELRRLLIRGNNDAQQQQLRDTSALRRLKQLEVLELEFCAFIRDLSPLPKLPVLNHRPAQEA